MKRKNRVFAGTLFMLCMVEIIHYGILRSEEWAESHSGIPDVVSSISKNRCYELTVVANSNRIDDLEVFAREVIEMCQQNAFHSMKFSTDIKGYPSALDITVYLNRKGVESNQPVCAIEFRTKEHTEDYDIKNDVEQFQLYLDGEEIDFN